MINVTGDRVAVVPLENPDMTPSGKLWIPDMAKDRLNQGFVKYIGPDVVDCYVGQYVLFSAYTGTLVHVTGEGKLIIMPEDFIVAELLTGEWEQALIPGVYFKGPIDKAQQYDELHTIMGDILPGLSNDELDKLVSAMSKAQITGPQSNPYFIANYEQIMEYVARLYSEDVEFRKRIRMVNKREPLASYDKTRGAKEKV